MVYLFLLNELKEKHIITRIERLKQFYFTKRKIQNQNLYLGIIKVIVCWKKNYNKTLQV